MECPRNKKEDLRRNFQRPAQKGSNLFLCGELGCLCGKAVVTSLFLPLPLILVGISHIQYRLSSSKKGHIGSHNSLSSLIVLNRQWWPTFQHTLVAFY